MTKKQLKGYVLNLFKYKSISRKQFQNAVNNLEEVKENDPLFYYFNMGKLHTAFGEVDDAIAYLTKAVELNPDHSSSYYNLYKCYVKKGDVAAAFNCFKEFLVNNKADVNFSFPLQIMSSIAFLEQDYLTYLTLDLSVEDGTKAGYNDLNDNEELAKVYNDAIKEFNARNYVGCLQKLHIMDAIISNTNYPMEVNTLICLVKILKEKEIEKCKIALGDKSIENASNEDFCKFQLRLMELGYYDAVSFLRKTEQIINNGDVWRAESLLNSASMNPKFEKYLDMIEYLRGFIREKSAFMLLDEEKQKEFTSRRLKAKGLYKKKRNERSLEEYASLKEEFGLVICDYYMAKILFRQGKFLEAQELFLSYLSQGGTKTEKAYMFLGKIEKIKKNKVLSKQYIKQMQRIHSVFNRDYAYISDNEKKRRKKLGIVDEETDDIKRRKSRTISMSEEDFSQNRELVVGDFYEEDLNGKLMIVRNLLQTGNVRVANKLFQEVQRECAPEERAKVKQFDKNRKIYLNQKRTSS